MSTPLASRDVNTSAPGTNPNPFDTKAAAAAAGGDNKPMSMEYHRQVLANKMAEGK
jgi:hypothetical protein